MRLVKGLVHEAVDGAVGQTLLGIRSVFLNHGKWSGVQPMFRPATQSRVVYGNGRRAVLLHAIYACRQPHQHSCTWEKPDVLGCHDVMSSIKGQ